MARLTQEDREQIRELWDSGMSCRGIAKELDLNRETVRKALVGTVGQEAIDERTHETGLGGHREKGVTTRPPKRPRGKKWQEMEHWLKSDDSQVHHEEAVEQVQELHEAVRHTIVSSGGNYVLHSPVPGESLLKFVDYDCNRLPWQM